MNHKASKPSHPSGHDDDAEDRSSDNDDAGSQCNQSDADDSGGDDDVSESDEDEVDYKQGGYHRVSIGGSSLSFFLGFLCSCSSHLTVIFFIYLFSGREIQRGAV